MRKAYRIISIEAADIYRQEQENGGSVGYKMPESKSDAYFKLFKIYLDNRKTVRYDLSGRKAMADGQHGVFIENGKKFVQ